MKKSTLIDIPKNPLARQFIKNGGVKKGTVISEESKMLNTKLSKSLILAIKEYCVKNEITIKEFMAETIKDKLKSLGYKF